MRIVFRKNGREIPFRSLENSIPSERNDAVAGRFMHLGIYLPTPGAPKPSVLRTSEGWCKGMKFLNKKQNHG